MDNKEDNNDSNKKSSYIGLKVVGVILLMVFSAYAGSVYWGSGYSEEEVAEITNGVVENYFDQPTLIYMVPLNCGDSCSSLSSAVQLAAEKSNLRFRSLNINIPNLKVPGIMIMTKDAVTPSFPVETEQQVKELMCIQYEIEEMCDDELKAKIAAFNAQQATQNNTTN